MQLYMGCYFIDTLNTNKSEYGAKQETAIPMIAKHSWPDCTERLQTMYECLHISSAHNILGYM